MKKLLFLITIYLVLNNGISWAVKIAVIDGFKPTTVYGENWQEYELLHGEEVASIIKIIHPDAEIIKFDYMTESSKRFDLSMDLKDWQESCEFTLAELIVKAVEEEVKIINISLKAHQGTQVLKDAVDYAWNNEIIICWAAGNKDEGGFFPPPDKYLEWFSNALIIGSTDYQGNISNFSNTGDIYIWGENINHEALKIWRLYLDGFLDKKNFEDLLDQTFKSIKFTHLGFPIDLLGGTSFSTPVITGLLAEILKYKDFSNVQDTVNYLMSFTKENDDGKNILLLEDVISMYRDFGFNIDNESNISFIPLYESTYFKTYQYPSLK